MSEVAVETEAPPMQGAALLIAGLVLALANFMAVLDTTIVNVSVSTIAGGLAVSPNEGTWAITSYSVAEAITVPLTGWLAQRFGTVRTFVVCIVMFGLFSALCGLAPSLGVLVAFRVLQGLSGGPLMPLSQALLMNIFPPDRRNQALGLWSMTTVTAPIIGPILGGWINDNIAWPWIFYINIPVAGFCAFTAFRNLSGRETKTRRAPIDVVGMILLVIWVGSLEIMLDKGNELDWFQSRTVVTLTIVALIGFVSFVIWELTSENPAVDLRLFTKPGFVFAAVVMSLTFGAFFGSVVLIPLWLQSSQSYTASWAGLVTGANGVFAVVMSPVVAQLVRKIDPRALISFGVATLGLVMVWRTTFVSGMSAGQLILPHLAMGFAMPFFFIPLQALAMSSVAPQQTASAAGLINFVRTVSGAFAVNLIVTEWDHAAQRSHDTLSGRLGDTTAATNAMSQAAGGAASTLGAPTSGLSQIDGLLQNQSVMLATNHVFGILALAFAAGALVVWLAPRPQRVQMGSGH